MSRKTRSALRQLLLQMEFKGSFVVATLLFALMLSCVSAIAREKPLDVLFIKSDGVRNGLINEAEWHSAMQKRFETIDTNHDRNVSREELESAKQKMREKLRSMPFRERGEHMFFE